MNVTIILCTYNRCESLATALESTTQLQMPGSVSWEVLVVDNNSKDKTREVVEAFAARYPGRYRYLFEGKQGKSNALNSGIRESSGEILAFLDDDVTVDAKWLQTLIEPFQNEQWAGVGGRINPERNFTPPDWLSLQDKYALAPLAIFELGTTPGEMKEAPFGTNMAFRREVFGKIGGFRTDLGPCPGSETRSEDTEFGFRALGAGLRLWYEPNAVVYHSLSTHRLQPSYFLAWWYDKARAEIRVYGLPKDARYCVAGVPLYFFRRLMNWTLRWMVAVDPAKRFTAKRKTWMKLGEISESYKLHARRKEEGTAAASVAGPLPGANSR